jgi:hypothetical protein
MLLYRQSSEPGNSSYFTICNPTASTVVGNHDKVFLLSRRGLD